MENRTKYTGRLIDDLVLVHFHWNGDLGALQQKTSANLAQASRLYTNDVINADEYNELRDEIINYYKTSLETVMKNPMGYIH